MFARTLGRALARTVTRAVNKAPPRLRLGAARSLAKFGIAPGNPSMFAAMERLRSCGFAPSMIVDVGACSGSWTREALQVWPRASVVMLEPRETERPSLARVVADHPERASYRIALLGSKRGYVDFNELEGGGTGSGVFEEMSSVPRKKKTLAVSRLDDELGDNAPLVQLLKLDVQGYEIEVLNGAPSVLGSCDVVIMEIALLPYNVGAPYADEVIAYMRARGFVLFDVASLWRDQMDRVFHMDAVFVRAASPLRRTALA